ncbi:MAG: indolepyruvate oxidoreductase subunit beta [bacterium]
METTSILFSGIGGQGIILASQLVAHLAFSLGFMVKESEVHGMAQRGGSVVSHVRFGKEVYSPLIPKGKADILVAMEELEGLRNIDYLKPTGRVILNTRQVVPSTSSTKTIPYPDNIAKQLATLGYTVTSIDALGIAQKLGNQKIENIILLGALSNYLPFPQEAWEKIITEAVPPKTVTLNLTGFNLGKPTS